MANIELVIRIPEETYNDIQSRDWKNGKLIFSEEWKAIHNGTPLPKGHGRLFDERDIVNGNYEIIGNRIYELEPIIEADKPKSEVKE